MAIKLDESDTQDFKIFSEKSAEESEVKLEMADVELGSVDEQENVHNQNREKLGDQDYNSSDDSPSKQPSD